MVEGMSNRQIANTLVSPTVARHASILAEAGATNRAGPLPGHIGTGSCSPKPFEDPLHPVLLDTASMAKQLGLIG